MSSVDNPADANMDEILASIRRIISEDPERQKAADTESCDYQDPFAQTTSPDELTVSERVPSQREAEQPDRANMQVGAQEYADEEVLELAPTMQATDTTEQSTTGDGAGFQGVATVSGSNAKHIPKSKDAIDTHGQRSPLQDPRDWASNSPFVPAASVDAHRESMSVDCASSNSATPTIKGLDEASQNGGSSEPAEQPGLASSAVSQYTGESSKKRTDEGYWPQSIDSAENEISVENESRSSGTPIDPWPAPPPLEGNIRSEDTNQVLTNDQVLTSEVFVQEVESPRVMKNAGAVARPTSAQSMKVEIESDLDEIRLGDNNDRQESELTVESNAVEETDLAIDGEAPKAIEGDSSSSVDRAGLAAGDSLNDNAMTPTHQSGGEVVRSLEDTVAEMLKPLLQEWLDANLPRMVEKAIQRETRQLASGNNQSTKST